MKHCRSLSILLLIFTLLSTVLFPSGHMLNDISLSKQEFPELQNSSVQAEETEWFFRINNGRLEKRLWSYTYGKWLTDWIDVGPAP